ncbi:MAG: SPOR domain-containing protein [Flavobacteriales bacterium]|nr:SPOR domain-containing protein [Flavobacteriales bacterium]MEB2340441.1 SPOR domain-containing protein [Flavobacteriia bacterium]
MALGRYLHQLLYEHDCVIVPDFGGFLTHYTPARLDVQRRLVHPPSKAVSFNRKLVRQDGLLVDQLIRQEGMDFQGASERVAQEVEQWCQELGRQGRLEVPGVGTFFHDPEHNLQFQPDSKVNFLKDAYGLRPVAAVPVPRATMPPAPVLSMPAAEGGAAREKKGYGSWPAAAAAMAIVFTAATWYLLGMMNPEGLAWGDLNVFRNMEPARYVLPGAPPPAVGAPATASFWTAPADLHGIHELHIAGPGMPPVAVNLGQAPMKAEPESTAVAVRAPGPRFHVIGGCFLEKENADRFVSELQARGFAASLVDRKGGLYRVAYGSYPLRATALEALNAVRKEEAPEAWLLVK